MLKYFYIWILFFPTIVFAGNNVNPQDNSAPGGSAIADIDLAGFELKDSVDGSVTIETGDSLDIGGSIYLDEDALWCVAPTTDVAPDSLVLHGGHSYYAGTQTASNVVVKGGIDEKYITFDDYANSAGDTLTITVDWVDTALVADTDWACSATSDAVCALALYAYVVANPITGVTPYCDDATCSTAIVYFMPDNITHSLLLAQTDAGGGDMGTITLGTDGRTVTSEFICLGECVAANPAFRRSGTTVWVRTGNDAGFAGINANTVVSQGVVQAGSSFNVASKSEFSATLDGDFVVNNDLQTYNWCARQADDTTMGIYDGSDCTSAQAVTVSGLFTSMTATVETPSADTAYLAAAAITASNGRMRVKGDSGVVILTSTPSIVDGVDGQCVTLVGVDETNTLTLQDRANLGSSGIENGGVDVVLANRDIAKACYDSGDDLWIFEYVKDNTGT